VTRFRVVVTATAARQIEAAQEWWSRERPAVPDLFLIELRRASAHLANMPGVGTPYPNPAVRGLRRILLRRTGYHVYYTTDADEGLVVIRAIWHGARGRGPWVF
jgi:plasmid stabilization system protein ParE